jgi:hypothetical protein
MKMMGMYVALLLFVALMLRNPGGTAGIISITGGEANTLAGTLGGTGIKSNSFAGNGVSIK